MILNLLFFFNTIELKLAIASRGDSERHEKGWADDCLTNMRIGPHLDITLKSIFCEIEIYAKNKINHFEAIHNSTKIPYEEMIFFDDAPFNLRSVKKLGVFCIHTPFGFSRKVLDSSLREFSDSISK